MQLQQTGRPQIKASILYSEEVASSLRRIRTAGELWWSSILQRLTAAEWRAQLQDGIWWALSKVEPWLQGSRLRGAALAEAARLIHYEAHAQSALILLSSMWWCLVHWNFSVFHI